MNWITLSFAITIQILSIYIGDISTFRCLWNARNITDEWLCDGFNDCIDGSDEGYTACKKIGKRPKDCHCKDVNDCFMRIGYDYYCTDCLDHYYGDACGYHSENDCHCKYKSDCKYDSTCICEDDTWQGIRCEQDDNTGQDVDWDVSEYKEIDGEEVMTGTGMSVSVIIVTAFGICVIAVVICIIGKRMRHSCYKRSESQQRGNTHPENATSNTNQRGNMTNDIWHTNRGFQATEPISDLPPSYDSLDFPKDSIPYPVVMTCVNDSTERRLRSSQGDADIAADVDADLPSYESLRR